MSDKSFEKLVNEHGRQVLGTAWRVLRDANLAHDVHQEVFLAVWRRWHRYNGQVNWKAYLYRVTVRKALEIARRRRACRVPVRASARVAGILPAIRGRPRRGAPLRVGLGTTPAGSPRHAREEAPHGVTTTGPADVMQADELQQKLAAALARLPRRQADAFVLSRLERLETAEIAKLMGCSEQTVRVHLHRAVIKLARELHEYLD